MKIAIGLTDDRVEVWDKNIDVMSARVLIGKANHRKHGAKKIAEGEVGINANAGQDCFHTSIIAGFFGLGARFDEVYGYEKYNRLLDFVAEDFNGLKNDFVIWGGVFGKVCKFYVRIIFWNLIWCDDCKIIFGVWSFEKNFSEFGLIVEDFMEFGERFCRGKAEVF